MMVSCTICGDRLPGAHNPENPCCESCYELNLMGNALTEPSYIVYEARRGPPLLLQATPVSLAESWALSELIEAVSLCSSPPPPFIPYEPRHMMQAIQSVEEARAQFIEASGHGDRASSPPPAS